MKKVSLALLGAVTLLSGCYSYHRVEDGYSRCDSKGNCHTEMRRHYHDHVKDNRITPMPTNQQGVTPGQDHEHLTRTLT